MPRVLVAPDKFKGSLTATEVADAVARGLTAGRPDVEVSRLPVADGGDGTLAAALAAGYEAVPVSATTDGGAGLLQALGARLLDADGAPVGPGGAGLERLARVDVGGVAAALRGAEVVVACDVDNPLTGPSGAAAVYGPQKGADPDDVAFLDGCLARLADAVAEATGRDLRDEPGAGAAGGVGFAALAVLGAQLRPGIDLMLDLLGFDRLVAGADLVVVREGSLDEESLPGKAPVGVPHPAPAAGVPAGG